MGERGPIPKITPIRRNRRPSNGRARTGRPTMPATLSAEAKREWRRVVPGIEAMGILTAADRGVLIRYCSAWSEWVEFSDMLAGTSVLVRGQKGELVRNPLWLLRRDAANELLQLSAALGLSPTSRLRNHIRHEPPQENAQAPVGTTDFEAERKRRLLGSD